MAAIHPNRYSHGLIEKSQAFGLHVLDLSQKEMLKRFKGPDPVKKFSGIHWEKGKTGEPIIKACPVWFALVVKERLSPGNHTLYIGEVIDCAVEKKASALSTLEYDGMYVGDK